MSLFNKDCIKKKFYFNSFFSSFSDHLYQPSLHFSPFQPGKHAQPSVKKNNTLIYSCLLNCSSVKYHVKNISPVLNPPPPPKKKLPLTNIFQVAEHLFSIQINHRWCQNLAKCDECVTALMCVTDILSGKQGLWSHLQ